LLALVPSQLEAALENFHTLAPDLAQLAIDLPRLARSVIVLAGPDDVITPPEMHVDWLAGSLPAGQLRPIKGTGHWLMRQRPELVAEAVREVEARG
jgi:pimeloyl-ACP methyl ester carboxylesterase